MSLHRILVVDRSPELANAVRLAMGNQRRCEVVHLPRAGQLLEIADTEGPWDAVVAGPTQATQAALRRLATLRESCPELGLLVAVNGSEPADLGMFVHARPDELVRLPVAVTALRSAVIDTLRAAEARRAAARAPVEPAERYATIYAVTGPTGGSGKTMVALNLAYLLAHRQAGRVIVVDLDLQFGEIAPALQLYGTQTLHHVLFDERGRPHDPTTVAEALAESLHPCPGGFTVLPAPHDPAAADAIRAEQLALLLELLKTRADMIVLDTATGLGEPVLVALDHADHVVTVTQIDMPGAANLRAFLETLDQLGVGADRRTIVLNKELTNTGLSSADIVKVIGPIGGAVPFDAAIMRALNLGLPVCAAEPTHPAARAIVAALEPLLPAAPKTPNSARRSHGGSGGAALRTRWWSR